jgi:hypothetical protein
MNRLLSCSVALSTVSWLVSLVVVLPNCSLASAQTVAINATNRGWYINGGSHNSFSSAENYFAGDSAQVDEYEYRDFFFFDLTSVSQPIASANLVLNAGSYDSQDPSENYELHDITTPLSLILHPPGGLLVPAYDDFGSGVVYGSRTMTAADMRTVVEIELNSSAIKAMNATHGLFGIGGSITTLDSLRNFEGVFGFTGSSQSISELRLTLVPEPSTFFLLGIGAISLLGYRKAKSVRVSLMQRTIACVIMLIAFLASVLNCCNLYAADVLDQSNVVATPNFRSLVIAHEGAWGQTVRAGLSGTLSRLALGVYRHYDVPELMFVDIVRSQNGQPSFAAADRLATRTLSPSQVPLLTTDEQIHSPAYTISVDFAISRLTFNSGDSFGIVLRSDATDFHTYLWWVAEDGLDTYPAGEAVRFLYSGSIAQSLGGADTHFATYMLVPEPSTLFLLGIGAISLLGHRKAKSHG